MPGTDQNVSELDLHRAQMGLALQRFAVSPGTSFVRGPYGWMLLTGAPGADANMILLHDEDGDALAGLRQQVEDRGIPAMIMLAGRGQKLAEQLGGVWAPVGSAPFMARPLAGSDVSDGRVRRAELGDYDTVKVLLMDSFGLSTEVAEVFLAPLKENSGGVRVWLLEQDGQATSTATTIVVDDVLTVWCVGTPERHRGNGYARALVNGAVAAALRNGARLGIGAVTPAGLPFWESLGGRVLEDWQIYTNSASSQFSP